MAYGVGDKGPDCFDGSDEIVSICCTGEFPFYTSAICLEYFVCTDE